MTRLSQEHYDAAERIRQARLAERVVVDTARVQAAEFLERTTAEARERVRAEVARARLLEPPLPKVRIKESLGNKNDVNLRQYLP